MIEPWYDLRTSLSAALGQTLIHWAKNLNTFPTETVEEWESLLYMHGCTLLRYGDDRIVGEASNYDVVPIDPETADGFNWKVIPTADGFFIDEDDVSAVEAKASLQWVADNFYTLWD